VTKGLSEVACELNIPIRNNSLR